MVLIFSWGAHDLTSVVILYRKLRLTLNLLPWCLINSIFSPIALS